MPDPSAPIEPGLYLVATPIGNLEDITLRALRVLKGVDRIACEDTRQTQKLLNHFDISTPTVSYHEHNEQARTAELIALLQQGGRVAVVSDAGTPAFSDPGLEIVKAAVAAGVPVIPIPGANAALNALVASGMDTDRFLYAGFLAAKPGTRRTELETLATKADGLTLVLYEAPHRIQAALVALAATLGTAREVVIARELTKRFESIHRCLLGDASAWIGADPDRQRGEFVLIVGAPTAAAGEADDAHDATLALLLAELPLARAVKLAVALTHAPKNRLYERALALKQTFKPPTR